MWVTLFSSELRHRTVWYITIVSEPLLPHLASSITNFNAVKKLLVHFKAYNYEGHVILKIQQLHQLVDNIILYCILTYLNHDTDFKN
jgi:hypothetical protein